MVSLSRYTIRAGLLIALLIIIGTLITSAVLVNGVQDNINLVEDSRRDHNSLDQDIEQLVFNISTTVNDILNRQSQYLLQNYISGDSGSTDAIEILNLRQNYTQIERLLEKREENNYNLSGVEGQSDWFTLQIPVPITSDILDTTSNGVFRTFNNFILFGEVALESAIAASNNLRTNINTEMDQLVDQDAVIDTRKGLYESNYDSLTESLLANGTSEAVQLLELTYHMNNNITSLLYEYQSVYSQLLNPEQDLQLTPLNTRLSNVNSSIEAINSSILSLGLNSGDAAIYDTLIGSIENLLISVDESSSDFNSFATHQFLITNFVSDQLVPLQDDFRTTFTSMVDKVKQENQEFNDKITSFLSELRVSLNSLTLIVSAVNFIVVFIVFIWVFLALSLNIGRIVSKITKLDGGDLRISTKSSYPKNEIGVIESSLDNFANQIRGIISTMQNSSSHLAGISEELAAGAEEASASIAQVNSTVREFASGSTEQSLMLSRVRDELIDHLDIVEQTANRIDETAKFVLLVAKRTNILGLNASIEAAKAGRFGLGFNVVAEEVRDLSNDTRASAREIKNSIEEIEFNIRQTVEDILTEVNIIREVAQNTSTGSDDASMATSEQVTMMTEISDTSNQLSEISTQLDELMKQFKV